MKAIGMAKASGMLGGSQEWLTYAEDLGAVVGNFKGFVITMVNDPAQYDRINEMPQEQKELEIRRILLPEGWDAKEMRIRREMGTA